MRIIWITYILSIIITALLFDCYLMHKSNESESEQISFNKYSEESTQDPISLLNDPQKFTTLFHTLATKCFELLDANDNDEAFACLNKLQDMLELGKPIMENTNPYWKLCFDLNCASVSQKLNQMYRSLKYCEKAESQFQQLLAEEKRADFILHLSKQRIKLKFQYCGVFSRLGQHSQAQKICLQNFKIMEKYLNELSKVAQIYLSSVPPTPSKIPQQSVLFLSSVSSFAEMTIKRLLNEIQQPVDPHSIKSPFYFWVCNPDNNCKQITQLFLGPRPNDEWKRSVLGVNKRVTKIMEFNVGTVMNMESRHIDQFRIITPAQQQLFKDRLYEIVFYVSVNCFILSTELRFTEKNKPVYSPSSFISKRYGYDEKQQEKQFSEAYHLKAIDIITQSISSQTPYLMHIVDSYQKHYIRNKPLQKIIAIPDESLWESSFAIKKQQKTKKLLQGSTSKDEYLKTKSKKKNTVGLNNLPTEKNSGKKQIIQNEVKLHQYQMPIMKKANKSVGKERKKNKLKKSHAKTIQDTDN